MNAVGCCDGQCTGACDGNPSTATSMLSSETASAMYPIKIEAGPTPNVLLSFAGGLPYLCADLQQALCLAMAYPAWVGSDGAPPQYSRLGEAQK